MAGLTGPSGSDAEQMRGDFALVTTRRTLRIPTAAYTDLVSTGNLRIIGDRALRDGLIRFYEEATRSLEVVASNNRVHIDGMIEGVSVREGLVNSQLARALSEEAEGLRAEIAAYLGS